MKPIACVGDSVFCAADTHVVAPPPAPPMPFSVMGTISPPCCPTVQALNKSVARKDDGGTHAACSGANSFTINSASATVVDGSTNRGVARVGDTTKHCGNPAVGYILTGCFTVLAAD